MTTSYRDSYEDGGSGSQHRLAMPGLTPVVKVLLIANAVVFGVQFALGFTSAGGTEILVAGLAPQVWADFFPFVPFWQLVTYGFLHSTGTPWHLLWNLLL